MRINTNVSSLTAQEASTNNDKALTASLEKLSTGLKINKASDDAAGLSIADKLRTQASGLSKAVENGNSASAMLQIGDKAMAEQSNLLDTIKTKLIQAATATTSSAGMEALSKDIEKLLTQVDNIAKDTNYNGVQLISNTTADGTAGTKVFQMGDTTTKTITLDDSITANVKTFDISNAHSIGSHDDARNMLSKLDLALTTLNKMRSSLGSTQNQVESSVRSLQTAVTNLKAAESVIRDVDYAQETANFNKQNIISQAGTYAISQANKVQEGVTKLLQ